MSTALNLVELRPGTTGDLAIVDTLMQRSFDPRYGESWTRAQCLGIMSMPGVWLTLASIDRAPAGFALTRSGGGEAELLLLAADPAVRRRGVGGALLRSAMNDAQGRGANCLYLEVRAGNRAAELYRSLGFVKVGERRGYYRGSGNQVFDAHTYRRDLE